MSLAVFDPDYARSIGVPVRQLRMIAMVLIAITLTASFHAAGAVLVIAFVVVPAAIASLFARTFTGVAVWSVVVAALTVVPVFFATYFAARPTASWTAFTFGALFVVASGVKWVAHIRRLHRARQVVS